MIVKSILLKTLEFLNKKKIFPLFLFICSLILSIIVTYYIEEHTTGITWILWVLLIVIMLGLPIGIRFDIFNLSLRESVNMLEYRLSIDLIRSVLDEYKLDASKFRFEIKKDDFINIAIDPFRSKIFITTGFMDWLDKNTSKKREYTKAILGHKISHIDRFRVGILKVTVIPFIILIICSVLVLFTSLRLIISGMPSLVQPMFLIYFFIVFLLIYLSYFWISRGNEYLADEDSVIKFRNAAKDMIEVIKNISGVTVDKIKSSERILEYFETHPLDYNRIKRLETIEARGYLTDEEIGIG